VRPLLSNMPRVRLTHLEISVAPGSLTQAFADDLDQLLENVFGWSGTTRTSEHPAGGPSTDRTYAIPDGPNLVLREGPQALKVGGQDHLGFVVEGTELDRLVAECVALAAKDERVELDYVEDGKASSVDLGSSVFRTFFVRYLLPVWFQFESRS
jgi:hypothetical protein